MKVLATYSIKGGVGKTSAAVNLASEAAGRGWRVLLWDLDPQGGATYLLRVRPKVRGGGRSLVRGTRNLLDAARGTDVENLDVVASDFRYRHLDLLLDRSRRPARQLSRVITPVAGDYDFVILDCAPPGQPRPTPTPTCGSSSRAAGPNPETPCRQAGA